MLRSCLAFILASAPIVAHAQPAAPPPGEESGRTDDVDDGDHPARVVGRGLLWIPRAPIMLAAQPIRGALYLQDKYNAAQMIGSLFVSDDQKIAIFPTLLIETHFGANVGGRAYFRDLLGQNERIKLRIGYGGQFQRVAEVEAATAKGRPVIAELGARGEDRDEEAFYGVGNTDLVGPTGTLADPYMLARPTRFRMTTLLARQRTAVKLPHGFGVAATGALVRKRYGDFTGGERATSIADSYDVERLAAFRSGTTFGYGELAATWDTRGPVHWLDAKGVPAAGSFMEVYGGRVAPIDDTIGYTRYGFDLQQFIRLADGPRVLQVRLVGDAVSGARERVPFSELPRLGGPNLLRGYDRDRFRDRIAAVAQTSYTWMLSRYLGTTLFVDAGRTYSDYAALSVDDLRVGYGGQLEVYGTGGLLCRGLVASSRDGGLQLFFSLDTAFGERSRVERN